MSDLVHTPIPEKLRFTLEPWGPYENVIDISLDAEKLMGNGGYWEGKRIPTVDEWVTFRKNLDSCGVWDWKGNYRPESGEFIDDGTPWHLWIRWGDKAKRCYGDGEFPESFDCVERAIKQLIGKQG